MQNTIKRCLALVLALALCTTSVPASAWAEAYTLGAQTESLADVNNATAESTIAEDALPQTPASEYEAQEPQVLFRTHVVGAINWDGDEGWNCYASPQEGQEGPEVPIQESDEQAAPEATLQGLEDLADSDASPMELLPFDSLEMRISDLGVTGYNDAVTEGQNPTAEEASASFGTIAYRVRNANGEWQDAWTAAPNPATCDQAITGVQAKLSEELDATYDLWYRAKDEDGEWMGWVPAGKKLEAAGEGSLYEFQAVLVRQGTSPQEDEATGPANDQDVADQDETDQQPSEEAASEPTAAVKPANENEDVATSNTEIEVVGTSSAHSQSAKASQESSPALEVVASNSKTKDATTSASVVKAEQANPSILYHAYVQRIGWQKWVKNGAVAGTTGKSLRMEGLSFKLKNASGGISCRAHVQSIGWQNPVGVNKLVGTKRKGLRMEAIKLSLTGNIATTHDIYYRTRIRGMGWQSWVKNGKTSGITGKSLSLEAIEVLLVKKGDTIPANATSGSKYKSGSSVTSTTVRYQTYVQGTGWKREVANGKASGTADKPSAINAVRLTVTGLDGGISYRTRLQGDAWRKWSKNGAVSGATSASKPVEAMEIRLTGNAKATYDIYYRAYVQGIGWMGWAKNGSSVGSENLGCGIEQIEVLLRKKGRTAPTDDGSVSIPYLGSVTASYNSRTLAGDWQGEVSNGATSGTVGVSGRIDQISAALPQSDDFGIRYSVRSNGNSWQSWKNDGAVAGKSGQKLTAIRFRLTGVLASHYNVWYRAHVAHVGWLGWAKNGAAAGSDSEAKPIEAFEVVVLPKAAGNKTSVVAAFDYSNKLNGVDISGWDAGININNLDADFVIIKATEGVTGSLANPAYYNPSYKTWANQALAQGKLVGFYHYANGGDPIKEADWFYYAIKDYKGRAVACLDWEGQGNPTFETGTDVAWCKKFLDRLASKFGGTPLIYTSKNVTNEFEWSSVAKDYPLWGAEYPNYDPIYGYQSDPWQSSRPWGAWGKYPLIFQYTGTGVLQKNGGIDMFDFDLFYGSVSDWKALLK